MSDAERLSTSLKALDEIAIICSGVLSHGADRAGVVEILETISAKARGVLAEDTSLAATKKAILDDEGLIVGIGETEAEARADAFKTVKRDESYIRDLVNEMMVRHISDALAKKVSILGGEVAMSSMTIGGVLTLVTTEESAAARGVK